jgi:hypothetical protein
MVPQSRCRFTGKCEYIVHRQQQNNVTCVIIGPQTQTLLLSSSYSHVHVQFLAYNDFDNTPNYRDLRKSWSPHVQDWRAGDPTWKGGLGKGIIGATNYLSSKGMNAFTVITFNVGGDDRNCFMTISSSSANFTRIDVSKTAQWEIVFEHADSLGQYMHFLLTEYENSNLLDGGELGIQRKVYYRELVARYGHHLALSWNIGEENQNTDAQRKAFAKYFEAVDPYNHPLVRLEIHELLLTCRATNQMFFPNRFSQFSTGDEHSAIYKRYRLRSPFGLGHV